MKHRIIAFLLAIFMIAGIFTACKKNTEKPDPVPPQDETPGTSDNPQDNVDPVAEYVYQASVSSLEDELIKRYSVESITSFCVSGKTAFLSAQCVDPDASTEPYYDPVTDEMFEGEAVYRTEYFAVNLDTMAVQPLQYAPTQMKEGREGVYILSDAYPGNDGTVWITETLETYYYDLPADFDSETDSMWNYYMSDDPTVTLMQFDASGSMIANRQLTLTEQYGSVYTVMPDMSGALYVATTESVHVFDTSGAETATLAASGGFLHHFGSRGIGYVEYIGSSQYVQMIDPATTEFISGPIIDNSSWALGQGSADYDCTYVQNGVIFGLNTQSETNEVVLDWLDCDINASSVLHYVVTDNSEIYALAQIDDGYCIVRAALVDSASVPVKEEIVLATINLSNDIRQVIIEFNQSHDNIRIAVRDYSLTSMQNGKESSISAIMDDIASGNVPDMLLTDSLPVEYLAQKGLLADLNPMIQSDPELGETVLMAHLFDVAEIEGNLYEIAPWFTISTAAGAQNLANGQWTIQAAQDAQSSLSDGATILSSAGALRQMITAYLYDNADSFIDWSSMTSSFNEVEMIEILNFINSVNSEISNQNTAKNSEYKKLYEKSLLLSTHRIDDLYDVKYVNALHRNDVAFVGYPTADGSLSLLNMVNPIAITTTCSNTSAAWEFVRTFLTDEYQQGRIGAGFPTNKVAFDDYANKMMTPVYTTDGEGNQIEISNGSVKLDDIITLQLYAVTDQEFNLFQTLYMQCTSLGRTNQILTDILSAEISKMLDGETPENTAAAIQSAVSTYLSTMK